MLKENQTFTVGIQAGTATVEIGGGYDAEFLRRYDAQITTFLLTTCVTPGISAIIIDLRRTTVLTPDLGRFITETAQRADPRRVTVLVKNAGLHRLLEDQILAEDNLSFDLEALTVATAAQ